MERSSILVDEDPDNKSKQVQYLGFSHCYCLRSSFICCVLILMKSTGSTTI
jgi:hypothetical protein